MKDQLLISVIIPAYNVENYIFRAIESVLNQTYSNYELIIVDDGSTDGTWDIIQSYAKNEKKMVIKKQKNSGVSKARNAGIEIAKGDFLVFLDSDDWLEINALETLIDFQIKYPDAFITVDRYFAYFNESEEIYKIRQNEEMEDELLDKNSALKCFASHKFNLQSSCYKLYKRDLIEKYKLLFNCYIYHGEDGLFVFQYINKEKQVYYNNAPLWNILSRENSATNSQYDSKWLTAMNAVEIMLNDKEIDKEVIYDLKKYYVERALMIKNTMAKSNNTMDYKVINKHILKYLNFYIFSNIPIKNKIYCLLTLFFPNILNMFI